MAKYDPNKERLGSQAHGILYKLPADQFDKICVEALHGLVREGICKRPQQISFNQR